MDSELGIYNKNGIDIESLIQHVSENKAIADFPNVEIITNENIYKTIDMCKVALAASGTITLQIALKKVPMCVFYKLSNPTYLIAKLLVKTKFISLVNIVLEKKAVHEFIQGDASSENIYSEIDKLINNMSYRNEMINNLDLLEKKLLNDSSKVTIYDLVKSIL